MRTSTKSGKLLPHFHENPTFERMSRNLRFLLSVHPDSGKRRTGATEMLGGGTVFSSGPLMRLGPGPKSCAGSVYHYSSTGTLLPT